MNRRSFIASTTGLALASLVPSWLLGAQKRRIDLRPFCASHESFRYQLRQPFTQEQGGALFRYATDQKIAVRVNGEDDDRNGEVKQLPPANRLDWSHDAQRGWRPWPKEDYAVTDDAWCLECDGVGSIGEIDECPMCDGFGEVLTQMGDFYKQARCLPCRGTGSRGSLGFCPVCKAGGAGKYPFAQKVGDVWVAANYDRKVRRILGPCEYRLSDYRGGNPELAAKCKNEHALQIKFDGGLALLMPLQTEATRKKLSES